MNRDSLKKLFLDPLFFKFVLVGVLNTIIGSAIMFVLYNCAGLGYWASSLINCVSVSVLSFFLNKYFTFRVKEWSLRMVVFFFLGIAVAYIAAYGIAKPFVHWLLWRFDEKIRDNVAMLTGMGLFTIINYLAQRLITFKRKRHEKK
ncbi:MAG: GtrA family protein [Treponema sp.]|jgi:putative flippase GtrA|nr:GtrA family protein [Treponema sp.]